MTVQTILPASAKGGLAHVVRLIELPTHLGISGVPVDFHDEPLGPSDGAKRPARITYKLGGCGRHGCLVAVANGISAGVLGPQAGGDWSSLCRNLAVADGIQLFLVERPGVPPGMSIAHPNGTPGRWDLDVQRSAPLTVDEVVNAVVTVEELPKSLFIGPTPLNEEAMQFHSLVANLSPQRALMAHPSFLHHPQMFGDIGRLYGFVQMNYAEACVLDVTTRELEELSCRVRFLLGESVDFAITNGPDRGLLWAEHDWYEILPCEVHNIVCDIGAGDVWGAAFMLARWYFGANPKEALSYANLAAAACISGRSIPRF